MKTVIEMAREAGFMAITNDDPDVGAWYECFTSEIEAFAALVRADEREADQAEHEADKVIIEYHEATIKRLEAAIRAEREACAKVCDEMRVYVGRDNAVIQSSAKDCATAIRARSNT